MPHHYAIFSAHFAPHPGGIETFTDGLARQLAREGDAVEIVTMRLSEDAAEREAPADGVRIWRLPCRPLMGGRLPVSKRDGNYKQLASELASLEIDRVLVNARFYRHSLEALRFAKRIGAPAVVLDHGSEYLTLGNPVEDAVLAAYEHVITALDKRFRPTFAGISRASTMHLRRFGISTGIVINNAIDAEAFRAQASARNFRTELGIGDGQRLVAFVGRLAPEKGPLPLADAAPLLGEDYVIAMAGEGVQRDEIAARNAANVHLLGALDRADLSALLSQSDALCLPTRSEGFCTSLLEAGAWGLPPVIPHVGGTDEVLGRDPSCGHILPSCSPHDIARGIEIACAQAGDAKLRRQLREHVEEACSWKSTTAALRLAYH